MAHFWDELGIAPTADASAIRRAYAARLKRVRPDADPQGFGRLRAAYERALTHANIAAPSRNSPTPTLAEAMPDLTSSQPHCGTDGVDPRSPALPTPPDPVPDLVGEYLHRGDVLAAADWLVDARTAGTLSLAADLRLTDQLGWTMAQDRTLPADAVRAAAGRLGWPEAASNAAWMRALQARLDAERWLAALHHDAGSRTRWLGAAAPIAACILLGRGRLGMAWLMGSDPRLMRRYGEYLLHAPMVGCHFDPVRVDAIGRLLTRRPPPIVTMVLGIFGMLAIAWSVGLLAAEFDPRLQDSVTVAAALVLCLALISRRRRVWLRRFIERWNRL